MTSEIKNVDDWLSQATDEERFNFLKERLEEAQVKIAEQAAQIAKLKENRNFLNNLIQTHKHDQAGNALLPAQLINFTD